MSVWIPWISAVETANILRTAAVTLVTILPLDGRNTSIVRSARGTSIGNIAEFSRGGKKG
jgi:hypothetical protein